MGTTKTISFTALPNGIAANGRLKLSVFVSARYTTDPLTTDNLDLHDNFSQFVDWPSKVSSFGLKFNGGAEVGTTIMSAAPRSDLWGGLFPKGTYLRPDKFDDNLSKLSFKTYAVKEIHAGLKSVYTYFAKNNPTDFPSVNDLLGEESPLRDIAIHAIPAKLDDSIPKSPVPERIQPLTPRLSGGTTTKANATEFLKVQTFHAPLSEVRVAVTPLDVEFHGMLTALGRYPALMRMLGLVFDLEVDSPLAPPATTMDATVEAVAHFTQGDATVPHVLTNARITGSQFYARRRETDPELTDDGLRMLPFDDMTKYEVVQVNHDGGALKTLRLVDSVVHAHFDPNDDLFKGLKPTNFLFTTTKSYKSADTPTAYSLPAMGTAGIAVARADHSTAVKGAFTKATSQNTAYVGGSVTLDAEDLTRGYAIDVYDSDTKAWHSLCERVGTYTFPDTTLSGIADEGWISLGMTGAQDGSKPTEKKLQETLFNFWGWSLVAPRPGKTMDANGTPTYTQNDPTTQFDLKVEFVAKPGSLPKLRFGTTYNLRARAVDLAGNATARTDVTGKTHATPDVVYGRFEPVASPEVVLDDALAEGDARDRLVIRSNYDTAISGPAIRHIAPPKAAEPMIEALGLFDTAAGFDADAYKLLSQKDGGSWTDIGKPDPNNPGVYYVKEQGKKTLPYLPDVLSRGALFRGLPGASAAKPVSFGYDSGQAWPDALPFDLVLREGSGAPQFDTGPRDLNVQLGKGDVVEVRVNSYLDPQKDTHRIALKEWMQSAEGMSLDDVTAFVSNVNDGVHWMVTPFRTLTLVHAVRQPLLRPAWGNLVVARGVGETFASLSDHSFGLSRKSTVRLDFLASWSETIDTDKVGPRVVQGSARPFQVKVPLDPAQESTLDINGEKHEFHDTKYRHVKYLVDGTSRFAEYFAERKSRMQVHAGTAVLLHAPVTDDGINWGGVVEGSETVTASDRTTKYARGTDYVMDYAAGTLTPLPSLDGKTINVTFIAPPIVRRTQAAMQRDVPSSARPAAPKVLYLVPTFGWSSSANQAGTEYKSERRGGGLRAYLDRPWFSSGDGEMLGVVIWTGAWPPDETTKMYVSDWGLDPMYKSSATTDRPTVGAFKTAVADTQTVFSLEELKPDSVHTYHVAGHPVAYDASRKLWYADIEIDAGASYTPFVRLALARYQPKSVEGVHLSRVVLADFVQLTANRTASLTRPTKQSDTLTVAVSGLSYSLLQSAAGPSAVEVSLERRRADTEPDKQAELAWEQVPASSAPLTPSAGPNGTTMWTGQVTLPKAMGDRFRVIIREFEKFGTGRRLVYADTIEVDR
jgi:hypothetical protein